MANQRMAGDIWKTYDVKSIGNDGFDDADLNHLLKQNYANNDILKIAAASGRVDASTDQRLRKLNNENYDFKKIPDKAKKGLFARGIMGNVRYLGGDPNDDKSYAAGFDDDDGQDRQGSSYAGGTSRGGGSSGGYVQQPTQWVNSRATSNIPRGDRSEILTWQGINADGSAAALRGTRVDEDRDGKKSLLKTRDTTWRVPDDYLPRRESSQAAVPAQQGSSSTQDDLPAPPLTERFDATRYMLNTPTSSASSAASTSSDATRRPFRFGYTSYGGGIELGGYERFIKGLPSGLA